MQYKHLAIEERESIQAMQREKNSIRAIARMLGRPPSCISRELKRNFPDQRKVYTPRLAHERALEKRASRGRKDRLKNETIRQYAIEHLKLRWSPEQIAIRMPLDLGLHISHEAIYQFIYSQVSREGYGPYHLNALGLRSCLRRRRKRRQPKGSRRSQRIFKPRGASIEQRPLAVSKRSRFGDWEGDTVESLGHKPGVNTLLERLVPDHQGRRQIERCNGSCDAAALCAAAAETEAHHRARQRPGEFRLAADRGVHRAEGVLRASVLLRRARGERERQRPAARLFPEEDRLHAGL